MSSRGQIPFVELNGRHIPDSNLAAAALAGHFGVGDNPEGVAEDRVAAAHLARVALENHTIRFGFYWRYTDRFSEFSRLMFPHFRLSALKTFAYEVMFPRSFKSK